MGNDLGVLSSMGATKEHVALARKEVKANRDTEAGDGLCSES